MVRQQNSEVVRKLCKCLPATASHLAGDYEPRDQSCAGTAEIVAAIGVILSLVFVALQIRQNTVAIRAQTQQQLADASAEKLLAMATTDLGSCVPVS